MQAIVRTAPLRALRGEYRSGALWLASRPPIKRVKGFDTAVRRGLVLVMLVWCHPAFAAQKDLDFNRDIRPILSDHCYACHGPDEKQRMAGLRLDTKEGAFADRGGYQVIVPGKASESKLYQKISTKDDAVRMPPPGFERNLTAKQIELIRQWIDQGAKWEQQWSFVPPRQPPLPRVAAST